jgi:hypothetical protein
MSNLIKQSRLIIFPVVLIMALFSTTSFYYNRVPKEKIFDPPLKFSVMLMYKTEIKTIDDLNFSHIIFQHSNIKENLGNRHSFQLSEAFVYLNGTLLTPDPLSLHEPQPHLRRTEDRDIKFGNLQLTRKQWDSLGVKDASCEYLQFVPIGFKDSPDKHYVSYKVFAVTSDLRILSSYEVTLNPSPPF